MWGNYKHMCLFVCVQTSKVTATRSEEQAADRETHRQTDISTVAQIRAQVILTLRTAGWLQRAPALSLSPFLHLLNSIPHRQKQLNCIVLLCSAAAADRKKSTTPAEAAARQQQQQQRVPKTAKLRLESSAAAQWRRERAQREIVTLL